MRILAAAHTPSLPRLGGGEYLTLLRVCPASQTERIVTSESVSWPEFGQFFSVEVVKLVSLVLFDPLFTRGVE